MTIDHVFIMLFYEPTLDFQSILSHFFDLSMVVYARFYLREITHILRFGALIIEINFMTSITKQTLFSMH